MKCVSICAAASHCRSVKNLELTTVSCYRLKVLITSQLTHRRERNRKEGKMFNGLPSIRQSCLPTSSIKHTEPVDNAGVSNQPASESPAADASRSPQHSHGSAIFLQRRILIQEDLLRDAKSVAKESLSRFFKEFDTSKLTQKSRIELARFKLEESPSALGEHIQKFQISDESARIDLARRLAERSRSAFDKNLKNFEIPCETAINKLADVITLEERRNPLPSSIAYKSLDAIAQESGVPIESLEAYLKKEISAFVEKMKNSYVYGERKHFPLFDKLYNLYLIAAKQEDKDLPFPWVKNLKNYNAFIEHFCPPTDDKVRVHITSIIESFVSSKVSSGIISHDDKRENAYGIDRKVWKKVHTYGLIDYQSEMREYWVDEAILAEVEQLKKSGYPNQKDHLFHNTGSAALEGIGEAGAILSAYRVLQSKQKVVTGEYKSESAGKEGLTNVYTLRRSSLASAIYTIQRWFDECPITFAIDVKKQREYNEAQGIKKNYENDRKGQGTVVGPEVPLEHVVAVSAPKEHEAHVQAWIQQYCPWAKFISKEAATIMDGQPGQP